MNRPQRLQWERLKITRYNNLEGERIAHSLEEHEALWDAFVFGRFHLLERNRSGCGVRKQTK